MDYVLFFPILIFFIVLYFYFTRNFSHWKDKSVPYIKPVPFFGNALNAITMRHCMGEVFLDLYNKSMKPVVGFFILDRPCLLLRDPTVAKRILVQDFQYFHDRSVRNNKRDDPISSHILFFLKNPEWKEIRAKISPVYTSLKLKSMFTLIEEAALEMTKYLQKEIRNNSIIDMKELCVRYTVDVIASTAFGVNAESFKNIDSDFYVEAKRITNWDDIKTSFRLRCYFLVHNLVKLFRMKMFHPTSVKFLEKSFLHIMDKRETFKTHRNDLIDILLELRKDDRCFVEEDILVSQALTFFVAGFETSSSATGFALNELALHPDIQVKLRNEIDAVSTKYGSLNYEALREMEYLDMCVKETLRKYPVVPFIERNCSVTYTIPETGTVIDKGTSVFVSNLALQYDCKYFPQPEIFDPERFSEKNKQKLESFSYLPFGAGPRNCIGARFGTLTVKTALANLLKNFSVDVCQATENKIKFNPNGIPLSAANGIKLKVKKI